MPTVHNPSTFNLWCEPADQEIRAGGEIEVSDEVAAAVSRCVFVVSDDTVPDADTTAEAEEEPKKAPATRKTATRGAKAAEVTKAPEVETRTW